jgi:hypothetical protein
MPDLLVTLLTIAAILLVADVLLAGGAMTMMGVGGVIGIFSHPLTAAALVVLVVALVLLLGGAG